MKESTLPVHPGILLRYVYRLTLLSCDREQMKQARSQITGPGGGSLAAFSFPDRNAAGGVMGAGGAGAGEDDEEEDLYS